jgi:hypothetical protein
MRFVSQHFPSGFAKTPRSNFTPNVRFDAIAVGVAEALRKHPRLVPAVPPKDWLYSEEFFALTTSNAANVRSKVVDRIEFVRVRLSSGRERWKEIDHLTLLSLVLRGGSGSGACPFS